MMSILVRPTDAENNSVMPIRNNIGTKTTSSSMTSTTTESQTQTSKHLGIAENDEDTHHISIDIETQTGNLI